MKLQDAYLSVHEALKHAGLEHGCAVRLRWVDAEDMSFEEAVELFEDVDGVLVPGGFGSRGWEGKILACRVAREREIPYLGICLGMHVAVSEFARHVVGLEGANSTEMDPETPFPVIDLLPEQKGIEDLGGTMRLGAQAVELADGTRARELYGEATIHERHRHRYEVNNTFRDRIVDAGLVVSGTFQEGRLVEIIELPEHPWFVASQFHPEFKSRPTRSAPLFRGFVGAALDRARAAGPASTSPRERRSTELLLELAAIPSPPGARTPSRLVVARYIRDLGLAVEDDDSGTSTRGSSRRPKGRRSSSAPISTPSRRAGELRPVVEDGVVRNAGGTILGADNKAAVAQMLEGVRRVLAENIPHAGIELVLTRQEEIGLLGAAAFDHTAPARAARLRLRPGRRRSARSSSARRSRRAWRSRSTAGPRTRACHPRRGARRSRRRRARSPTCGSAASTRRRPRTSGSSPAAPRGTSSPTAARSRPRRAATTSGSSASSCRRCSTSARSPRARRSARWRASRGRSYRGYRFAKNEPVVELVAGALARCGHEVRYGLSGGAADANVFNERGLRCVNITHGVYDFHSPNERVAVADLEAMVDVTVALVEDARL